MEGKKDRITFTTPHSVAHYLYRFHKGNDERPFLADTDVLCKGGFIPVHSVVLMAGSPVMREHLMDQSRAQRDYMVIYLTDYHISDVLHVITCFYTGMCTFPRSQANTVFEIFAQLGVELKSMSYAIATPDEIKKRSCIRRYLDCDDDDDDMFIEDDEVITVGDIPSSALSEHEPPEDLEPTPKSKPEKSQDSPDRSSEPIVPPVNSEDDTQATEARSQKKKRRKVVLLPKPQPPEVKTRAAKVTRDGTTGIKDTNQDNQSDTVDNDDPNSTRGSDLEKPTNNNNQNDKEIENKMDDGGSSSDDEIPSKKAVAAKKRKASTEVRGVSKRRKISESPAASTGNKSDDEEGSVYKASEDEEEAEEDDSEGDDEDPDSEGFIVDDASSEDREFVPKTKRPLRSRSRSKRGRSIMTRTQKKLRKLPERKSKMPAPKTQRYEMRRLRNRVLTNKVSKDESEDEEAEGSDHSEEEEASEPSEEAEVSEDQSDTEGSEVSEDAEASDQSDGKQHKKRGHNTRNSQKLKNKKDEQHDDSDSSEKVAEDHELDEASNYRRESSSSSVDDESDDDQLGIDAAECCYLKSVVIKINKLPDEEIEKYCRRKTTIMSENDAPGKDNVVSESSKLNSAGVDSAAKSSRKHKHSQALSGEPLGSKDTLLVERNSACAVSDQTTLLMNSADAATLNNTEPTEMEASSFLVSPQQIQEVIKACPQLPSTPVKTLTAEESQRISENSRKWRDVTLNCPICKKGFENYIGALRCITKHKKTRCWICLEICDSGSYREHCRAKHSSGNLKDGQTNCPICEEVVPWNSVQNHISRTHFDNTQESVIQSGSSISMENQASEAGPLNNPTSDVNEIESEDERPLITIKDPRMLFESDQEDLFSAPAPSPRQTVRKRRGRPNKNDDSLRLSEDRRIAEAIGRERPKRKQRNKPGSVPSSTPANNSTGREAAEVESSGQAQVNQGTPNHGFLMSHSVAIQNQNASGVVEGVGTRTINSELVTTTNHSNLLHNSGERIVRSSLGVRENTTERCSTNSPVPRNTTTEMLNRKNPGRPNSSTERFAVNSTGLRNEAYSTAVSTPVPASQCPRTANPPLAIESPPYVPSVDSRATIVMDDNSSDGATTVVLSTAPGVVANRNVSLSSNSAVSQSAISVASVNTQRVSRTEEVGEVRAQNIASQIINQLRINNQSTNASQQTNNGVVPSSVNVPVVAAPRIGEPLMHHVNGSVNNRDFSAVNGTLAIPGNVRTRLISNPPSAPTGSVLLSSRNAVAVQQAPMSYQRMASQQTSLVSTYGGVPVVSTVDRRNPQVAYQPPPRSDDRTVTPPSSVPMMLSSRDVSSVVPTEPSSSRLCGVTTIGGVPFKVYSRPGTADPHPHALVSVSENYVYPNRCDIQTPQSVARPNQSYPSIPNLNPVVMTSVQNFQNALQSQESSEAPVLRNNSSGGSHIGDQRIMVAQQIPPEVEPIDGQFDCSVCQQRFRCDYSFQNHLCLEAD